MANGGKEGWRRLGCAALAGAAIAFPIGVLVGGDGPPRETGIPGRVGPSGSEAPRMRNVYSPAVTSDPYVIEEQRRVLEALELSCRQFNSHCAEAGQARLRIREAEARR